ncbi:MAG: T9SS type A sorting domain-containing protein [Bacteroidota bacterium]
MKKVIFTLALIISLASSFININATNVSGGIYSNTTWTLLNSPYIVTDTIVVFPGVTLTIEPGVVVKFADHKYIEIRQANLIAIGTALDSITFTSNNTTPTPGIWGSGSYNHGGIWLNANPSHHTSKFSYCSIKYATIGICDYNQDSLFIIHTNFTRNLIGINTESNHYANIDSSSFTHNDSIGITGTGFAMKNCNLFYNFIGAGEITSATLSNCAILYNQSGIFCSYSGVNYISNCIIDSNIVRGIYFGYGGDSLINCQIKYNGTGVESSQGSSTTFMTRNDIENNHTGIIIGISTDIIYCNKISNNTTYDLYYTVNNFSNLSIPHNAWGATDSATIHSHIYDGYSNINLGLVSVLPVDTLNCYLSGCNLQLSTSVVNATCHTCANGTAHVSVANGFAPYTYTWNTSPIQTTAHATGLLPGTYTVCVIDGNGCTACHAVYVDSTNCTSFHDSLLSVSNATCALCSDGSATINIVGGTTPYQYTWYTSPMQSTATATGLLYGSYQVCVFDAAGCHLCDTAIIGTGNCSAHFNLYPDTNILHNYFAVNMASGATPISYDWNWGDNSPHDFTPFPSHQYANAGYYNICLSITDAVGCTSTYCNNFYLLRTSNTMVYVNVVSTLTTGLNSLAALNITSIFPNPATSSITVHQTAFKANQNFIITDVLGNKVYAQALNSDEETMDISHLNSGIYFYEINGNRGKIIKE